MADRNVASRSSSPLFCYQVKKWIGSFAASLGGLDTLVFTGGVGENAPAVRKRIFDEFGFLGIELDQKRNAENAPLISADARSVEVRVIHTDEELTIARGQTHPQSWEREPRKEWRRARNL
jgi:propionate kinase